MTTIKTVGVRLMPLRNGAFLNVEHRTFDSENEALEAIEAYATAAGYSSVQVAERGEITRVTATTRDGRTGHNVAFLEP